MRSKAIAMALAAAAMVSLSTAVLSGCIPSLSCPQQKKEAAIHAAYAKEVDLAFEGGHARIGLYDHEAAMEFAERAPLSVQLLRQPDKILLQGLPPSVFARQDSRTLTPVIGDIVMDVRNKDVALYCVDQQPTDGLIPLGHVLSGMEDLSRKDGIFEAFAVDGRS